MPFTGKLLIADRGNGRIIEINSSGAVDWVFPRPGQHLPVPFGAPDDAFYTADGKTIIANAEGRQTVTAIDRATGTILWQVGHYNVRSSARGYFNEPDDAVPQPDGTIWVADIRNCRLVHLSAAGAWLGTIGNRSCRHNPPTSFAEPNGAFPTSTGSLIVTEIGGSWVTDLVPGGSVAWSVRAPVRYPSDAMQMAGGSVLLTDYSRPGAVVRLSSTGRTLWYYRPVGPSRAQPHLDRHPPGEQPHRHLRRLRQPDHRGRPRHGPGDLDIHRERCVSSLLPGWDRLRAAPVTAVRPGVHVTPSRLSAALVMGVMTGCATSTVQTPPTHSPATSTPTPAPTTAPATPTPVAATTLASCARPGVRRRAPSASPIRRLA